MARKKKPLTKRELASLRKVLEKERDGFIFKNVYLHEQFNINDEDRSDDVDQANADVSNAQRLRFRNRESFYGRKILEALRRIEKGEYGICEECAEPISYRRLSARPTAEQCILCKEESERDESSSIFGRKSKSLGKEINLVGHI